MKLTREQLLFGMNLIAMTVLFVGYILTTGLQVVDPDTSKNFFRFASAALAIAAIVLGFRLTSAFLGTIYLFGMTLLASGNSLNLNLMFLAVAVQALTVLTAKQASIVLFLSSAAGVAVHLLARAVGIVGSVSTSFSGRTRSAAGFANANQTALIYLTLIAAALLMHQRVGSKWTRLAVILSLLVSLPTMLDSDSRTSLFSLIVMFALYPVIKLASTSQTATPVLRTGIALAPAVAVALTLWLAFSTSVDLDIMFSYRPRLFGLFLQNLPTRDVLLGWQIYDFQTIDNSYLTLLATVGALVMGAILLVIPWLMFRVRLLEAPIAIMVLVAGITESFMVRPEILLSSIFLAVLLGHRFKSEQSAAPDVSQRTPNANYLPAQQL